jgi:hypothetical protein
VELERHARAGRQRRLGQDVAIGLESGASRRQLEPRSRPRDRALPLAVEDSDHADRIVFRPARKRRRRGLQEPPTGFSPACPDRRQRALRLRIADISFIFMGLSKFKSQRIDPNTSFIQGFLPQVRKARRLW